MAIILVLCKIRNHVASARYEVHITTALHNTQMAVGKLDGTGHKILVIDDDLAIRVLLQAVLRRMKFEVTLAEDGAVGLDRLNQDGEFDLILLDLMMPRVNGYEFIERIKDVLPHGRPHIIVFTAAGKRGVDKIPADAVCNAILKPFDLEKFIEMIAECLRGPHNGQNAQSVPPPA